MKHDSRLADSLIIQSLEAKVARLAARIDALESRPRARPKRRRAQRTTDERDQPAFAIMKPICQDIAARYRLDLTELRGRDITAPRLKARAEAMAECQRIGISTPVIGRFFDGRDHATVLHLVKAHGPKSTGGSA